ncbi:MAG TPA: hypothetical protein VHB21_26305, partial [Minicystis sp.]|nr:hypothetical protein [Minicystis sp.]
DPGCQIQCVPDDPCPPGFVQEIQCSGGGMGSGVGGGGMVPPPPDGNDPADVCTTQCVPACPPGTVPETQCGPDPMDPNGMGCSTTCVPDMTSSVSTGTGMGSGGWQPF